MLKTLHKSQGRQATWLELFFDLVFVAAIGFITNDLSQTQNGHIAIDQLLKFPLVFVPLWWIWTTHTLYANRFDNNDHLHRFFALIIMGLIVFLSIYAEESRNEKFFHFSIVYASIRVLLAAFYLRIHSKHKKTVAFAKDMTASILLGAIISGSSFLFKGDTKFFVFYAGIGIDMLFQLFLHRKTKHFPVDRKHLVERVGLLAIIILGESVINMIGCLADVEIWDNFAIMTAITGFTLIWAIWWIYYDRFSSLERAKRIVDGNILIYSHLILCMGLLILANLIGHSIKGDLDQETFQMLAILGMCGFYFGKQVIYFACFPPYRKMIILNTAICIAITAVSTYLPRIEYSLVGMTFGMLVYIYSTFRWLLPQSIHTYLD